MKNLKRIFSLLMSLVLLAVLSGAALAAFTDTAGHKYEDEVEYSRLKGYVTGFDASTFKPDTSLTRAQLAVVWARFKLLNPTNPTFTDLTMLSKYYDTAALLMYGLGIMKGTSPTTFSPESLITREQLIAIAVRDKTGAPAATTVETQGEAAFTDADMISEWAKESVESAVSLGLLAGLYDDATLDPQTPVTRAEVCKLIYNIDKPAHTVTIDAGLAGGAITADPTSARAGTAITLTINPDTGKRLKADTLKMNGTAVTGTSFVMPKRDVLITAEFEDAPTLVSIAVKTPPDKTTYTVGETLDLTGLTIEATLSDDSKIMATGYTATPAAGSLLDTAGTVTVTVSYTLYGVTKTTTFSVTVAEAAPETTPETSPGT
jgi:hypothetical protein